MYLIFSETHMWGEIYFAHIYHPNGPQKSQRWSLNSMVYSDLKVLTLSLFNS